jgi:hydroxyacylglutathione hydrolase
MPASSIRVETVVDSVFEENAYIVSETPGGTCWVIDPSFPPQPERISGMIRAQRLQPAAILITHTHGDHIVGIDALYECWKDLELAVPAAEAGFLADADKNLSSAFGLDLVVRAVPTRLLRAGDTLSLETLQCRVLDVSGHSLAGLAFYCPAGKAVFTGDALFAGSIGRTDLPGASESRLLHNIRQHLLSLPDDVIVYPGHGPSSTIGQERRTNPFLRT